MRRSIGAEQNGRAGHSLTTDDPDLAGLAAGLLCHDRCNALVHEEHVFNLLVRLLQLAPERQPDPLKIGLQQTQISGGQCLKKLITVREARVSDHGSIPFTGARALRISQTTAPGGSLRSVTVI